MYIWLEMEHENTKGDILTALVELARSRSLDKVYIRDVAEAAGVSRQTFYYHFEGIFDVFAWAVRSRLRYKADGGGIPPSFVMTVYDWFRALHEVREATILFFNSKYITDLHDFLETEFRPVAKAELAHNIGDRLSPESLQTCANFLVSANLGTLGDWIRESMEAPLKDVFRPIDEFMRIVLNPDILKLIVAGTPAEGMGRFRLPQDTGARTG